MYTNRRYDPVWEMQMKSGKIPEIDNCLAEH